ncbi:MAG: hypothetical protein ACYS4W_04545 [Planctomycetota bacterium]|jgi:hypothetical protein
MEGSSETRKYEAYKIALLGLFVLGLLIAQFITSSRYTGPRKAGKEVVGEVKHKGIASFLDERGWRSFFLVRNARGRIIGFSIDAFVEAASGTRLRIQSTGLLHLRSGYRREQVMSFKSDDNFNEFSWKSESAGRGGRSGTEIVREEDGLLTVTRSNHSRVETSYEAEAEAVPEYLLELVLSQMLESNHSRIIIDTISPEGRMVEVAVSIVRDVGMAQTETGYYLKVDFPDKPRYSQKVYFDDRGRISKILVEQEGAYLFERADAEDMLRFFPDWADYFLQQEADRSEQ